MPLIAITALKGAPGVTSTALALAAWWPEPERVMVETDPAGGDLAVRCQLDAHPGLVEVAVAEAGEGLDPVESLARGTQRTRLGGIEVAVVCSPIEAVQAAPTVRRLARPDSKALSPAETWAIADCGRAWPASPAWPLLARADLVVVVVEGTVAQSMNVLGAIPHLWKESGSRVALAVAPGPYPADAMRTLLLGRDLPVPVLGDLPPMPRQGQMRRSRARTWRDFAARAREAARVPLAAIGPAPESRRLP